MSASWWTKPSQRRKARIRRTRIRWDLLGLQDPAGTSSAPSIEDVRRQILSASSNGLSPDTLARAQANGSLRTSVQKATRASRKRGSRS